MHSVCRCGQQYVKSKDEIGGFKQYILEKNLKDKTTVGRFNLFPFDW